MDIPGDIMRAAGDAILKGGQAYYVGGDFHTAIARALLAEREACAKIAEDNNHFPAEGEWIASLIRTPSTGEEQ